MQLQTMTQEPPPLRETRGTPGSEEAGYSDSRFFAARPVPASELFCHPSRLANTYEPGIEVVRQTAFLIPGEAGVIDIRQGVARPPAQTGLLNWRPLDAWHSDRLIDLKERLVYDARPVFNGNMAHLVQHHLAALGYLKARLGYGRNEVLVVLEAPPAKIARQAFAHAGYEVLATQRPVRANRAEISLQHFFHLLPWVRHLDIALPADSGPHRLFISRRASRRLVNETEIGACLREHGFEKVYFEDLAIPAQWSLMRHATHIAAIHGAALGCLPFQAGRKGKTQLLEFFGAGFVVNPFRKFMAVLGGDWAACRGRITPAVARDIDTPGQAKAHAFDDFELAVTAVEAGLAYLDQRASS